MVNKLPQFAIALYKTKIEFFQKKLENSWSVVDRIDLASLDDARIGDEFAERAGAWLEKSREVSLWLPQHICHEYQFDEPRSVEAIYAAFMSEKRISNVEIVIFEDEVAKAPKYRYLAIEREPFESTMEFVMSQGFDLRGFAVSPSSSTFVVPHVFDADSREDAGTEEVEAPSEAHAEVAEAAPEVVEVEPEVEAPAEAEAAEEVEFSPSSYAPSRKQLAIVAEATFVVALIGAQLTYSYWGDLLHPSAMVAVQPEAEVPIVADGGVDAALEGGLADEPVHEEAYADPEVVPDDVGATSEEIAAADAAGEVPIPPTRDEVKIAAIQKRIEAQTQISGGTGANGSEGSVDLGGLMLIGIYGPQGKPQAMIRSPSGGIHTVKMGATVDGWQVVAISRSEVIVSKGNDQMRLTVPN